MIGKQAVMHLPELTLLAGATRRPSLGQRVRVLPRREIAKKVFDLAGLDIVLVNQWVNFARVLGAK